MKFKEIAATNRSLTIELENDDIYYAKESYDIYVNGIISKQNSKKNIEKINNVPVISLLYRGKNIEILRKISDSFREEINSGIIVLGNLKQGNEVQLIAAVTDDLVKKGYHAGNIIKAIAKEQGGSGGGRPQIAQAGIKKLDNPDLLFANLEKHLKVK